MRFKVHPILVSCVLSGLVFSTPAFAQTCMVGVRVIKGTESGAKGTVKSFRSEKHLEDMESQLKPLPYRDYRMMDNQRQSIAVGKEGTFKVLDFEKQTHTVSITPHGKNKRGVQLTVDWKGPNQEQMLSTKLRVESGKCVVLGTDSGVGKSTILAVKADCN